MPPRFETQPRDDGSTLVVDLVCGYQFTLPKDSTVRAGFSSLSAQIPDAPTLFLSLSFSKRTLPTFELEFYNYTATFTSLSKRVVSQIITTNMYGTTLGTMKFSHLTSYWYDPDRAGGNVASVDASASKTKNLIRPLVGPGYYESYEILFLCEEEVVHIGFHTRMSRGTQLTSKDMQLIYNVQNSIWFK